MGLIFMCSNKGTIAPRNKAEWDSLYKASPKTYQDVYHWFMVHNSKPTCKACPENQGFSGNPCGQQKCWVDVHRAEVN